MFSACDKYVSVNMTTHVTQCDPREYYFEYM